MTLHIHERGRYFNGVFGTTKAIVWHYILNKLPNTPLCFQWVSGNWPRSEGKHALTGPERERHSRMGRLKVVLVSKAGK
jgi:hypothetical protein